MLTYQLTCQGYPEFFLQIHGNGFPGTVQRNLTDLYQPFDDHITYNAVIYPGHFHPANSRQGEDFVYSKFYQCSNFVIGAMYTISGYIRQYSINYQAYI